jgi:hypothetical protein
MKNLLPLFATNLPMMGFMDVAANKTQSTKRREPAEAAIHIVRGRGDILAMHQMLIGLSTRCDQPGAMDHLEYFLTRPKFANKIPCLILFGSASQPTSPDELEGAILLYEYQLAGFGCRIFVADYHGGDRTVIAPAQSRAQFSSLGCAALLKRGALAVQMTYQAEGPDSEEPFVPTKNGSAQWRRATSVRAMNGYVPLEDSYDATLAQFGKHTRRNLRASRRHAATSLGYTFVADPVVNKVEFMALNRVSTYPASEDIASWRYDALKLLGDELFLGIRGSDGEWLSLIGGRRQQNGTYVEWQMNRADMAEFSLGTLMRSHLIEHEIEKGSRRLYLVGGTSHSMKYAFGMEHFVDLVALRRALPSFLLRRFGRPLMLEGTFLVQTVADPNLKWLPW